MPPITFRPVPQSGLGGQTAQLLQGASNSFSGGADRIINVLQQRAKQEQDNIAKTRAFNTQEFQNYLRSFATPEDLQAARASGAIDEQLSRYGGVIDQGIAGAAFQTQLRAARENAIAADEFGLLRQGQADRPQLDELNALLSGVNAADEVSLNEGVRGALAEAERRNREGSLSNAGLREFQEQAFNFGNTREEDIRGDRTAIRNERDAILKDNAQARDLAVQQVIPEFVAQSPDLVTARDALKEYFQTAKGPGGNLFTAKEQEAAFQTLQNQYVLRRELTPAQQRAYDFEASQLDANLERSLRGLTLPEERTKFFETKSEGDAKEQFKIDYPDDTEETIRQVDIALKSAKATALGPGSDYDHKKHGDIPWGNILLEAEKRTKRETSYLNFVFRDDVEIHSEVIEPKILEVFGEWLKSKADTFLEDDLIDGNRQLKEQLLESLLDTNIPASARETRTPLILPRPTTP